MLSVMRAVTSSMARISSGEHRMNRTARRVRRALIGVAIVAWVGVLILCAVRIEQAKATWHSVNYLGQG